MATHTFDELKRLPVVRLREIASGIEHEAVQGHTQMHKDKLLIALCTALGLEMHAHHEVVGIDKAKVKARIRALKRERDAALEARDSGALKKVRREIHRLKRRIRAAMR